MFIITLNAKCSFSRLYRSRWGWHMSCTSNSFNLRGQLITWLTFTRTCQKKMFFNLHLPDVLWWSLMLHHCTVHPVTKGTADYNTAGGVNGLCRRLGNAWKIQSNNNSSDGEKNDIPNSSVVNIRESSSSMVNIGESSSSGYKCGIGRTTGGGGIVGSRLDLAAIAGVNAGDIETGVDRCGVVGVRLITWECSVTICFCMVVEMISSKVQFSTGQLTGDEWLVRLQV